MTLLEQRSKAIADARAILDAAKADGNRALSGDEISSFDRLMADADRLQAQADHAAEQREAREARLRDPERFQRERENRAAALEGQREADRLNRGGAPYHEEPRVVLAPEQRCIDAVRNWRGVPYAGESDRLSLGAVIRGLAFGDRRSLSPLEHRVMSEGTDAAGGFTVPDVLGAQFFDRARNAMVAIKAGAQTVPMSSDTLSIARLASGPSLAWKAENASITAGDLTLERVQFVAKALPILVKLSVELSEDSVNVEQIIERELSAALAGELDRVALRGSGSSNEPTGIRSQSGVTVQNLATNGATPADFDFLLDAGFAVAQDNWTPSARIYSARTAKTLAKLKDTTGQPLRAPEALAAWPELVTNAIPVNLTIGTSTDCSEAYVGDFRELLVGVRTSFRLEVSRVAGSAFENLQIYVRAYLRADVQLAHPKAFTVVTGIRP
jgi:HK97 family phage major capsid protein